MNAGTLQFAVSSGRTKAPGTSTLQRERQLNRFLADVEGRALRIAELSLGNRDDALDLVQEAMIKLAERYADRDSAEWPPLFYRILQNGIRDFYRRLAVRKKFMVLVGGGRNPDYDPVATAPDPGGRTPEAQLGNRAAMEALAAAIRCLPGRQREAFVLRSFEGLDVAGTATAMGCSDGSVKTHYSRAVRALRDKLGEHWQ